MKNVLSFLFVAGMITLAACGGKKEESTEAAAAVDTTVTMDTNTVAMDTVPSMAVDTIKK